MPSTAIRRVFYRAAARELDVEFVTGRVYRYFAVPEAVATGFARYRSKGAYFNRALRDRFRFEELDGWEEVDGG
jgi:hypothetical protein